MDIISGKSLSQKIEAECAELVKKLPRPPQLAIITTTSADEASKAYMRNKHRACERVGVICSDFVLTEDATEDIFRALITRLNKDEKVDGIIVQLPLPAHINSGRVQLMIDPEKDVDGFIPGFIFKPCTPEGIIALLKSEMTSLAGKTICMVGRGQLVGRPLRHLLDEENATVISCHSHTPKETIYALSPHCDAIILATGNPLWFNALAVDPKPLLIDCGCFRVDGKIRGEVFNKENRAKCTPDLGGVGPMTVAMLVRHTVSSSVNRQVSSL